MFQSERFTILLGHQHTWNSLIIIIKHDSPQVAKYLNNNSTKTRLFFSLKSVFIPSSPHHLPLVRYLLASSCRCNPTLSDPGDGPGKSAISPVSSEEMEAERERTCLQSNQPRSADTRCPEPRAQPDLT